MGYEELGHGPEGSGPEEVDRVARALWAWDYEAGTGFVARYAAWQDVERQEHYREQARVAIRAFKDVTP